MNQAGFPMKLDAPMCYRIRVQGALDDSWSDYLGGMDICCQSGSAEDSVTTLTGSLIDQASLIGILNSLYNLGRPLLSVERIVEA